MPTFDQLPAEQQAIIELVVRRGRSYDALSEALGIPSTRVRELAREALTDLVYIQLPDIGRQVRPGQPLGEVESVKAVSDIYSPVQGEVVAVNDKLASSLDLLGSDPYGEGWIAKIKLNSDDGLAELMDYSAYQQLCAEEHG